MRVKFANINNKLRKSSSGYTFQSTSRFDSMRAVAQIKHERSPEQYSKINGFMYFTRLWRTLPGSVCTNWNKWAVFLPQRTKFSETKFLTGYQCFLRRNYYQQLLLGVGSPLMDAPVQIEYENDFPFVVAAIVGGRLLVDFTFDRSDSTIEVHLFMSGLSSNSINYNGNNYRFIASVLSFDQTIDITVNYLQEFFELPEVGSIVFASIVCAGIDNGQLWFHEQIKRKIASVLPVRSVFVYTYYATTGLVNFMNNQFRVPNYSECENLIFAIGGWSGSSDVLRCQGLKFWNYPNDSALNSFGFSAKGTGGINFETGYWENIKTTYNMRAFSLADPETCFCLYLDNLVADADLSIYRTNDGFPVRLCNPNTLLSEGEFGVYIGNDGKQYQTRVIGGVEWMLSDLQETRDYNGVKILFRSEGAQWLSLSPYSAAYCSRNIFDF